MRENRMSSILNTNFMQNRINETYKAFLVHDREFRRLWRLIEYLVNHSNIL